jgi:disulfide bond formation protein DsbB
MSTNTVTLFFALLAIACNAFVVIVAVAWFARRRAPEAWDATLELIGPSALTLAAVIAVTATVGSLYLSEVAHFLPCRLCWYQRIGMYPLAVILPIAAFRKDTRAWLYPFALAIAALPISIYHVLLEHFPALETAACDPNNPCSIVWTRHFGVVTIPYMAASGFAAIAVCALLAARWRKETNSCQPEPESSQSNESENNNASSSTASLPVS